MDKISTKTRKNQKFQPKISNFSENISKSCCICCTADGCRHRSEIVKSKHYQSTQFFKETFSDHNNKIKIEFWYNHIFGPKKKRHLKHNKNLFILSTYTYTKMLYFWLTNAVHQANRASMESMDLHLGQFNQRKKKNKKQKSSEKLKKKFQSEPDLSYGAGPSTSLQNCCSNCGGAVGQNWPPNGQNSKRRTSATVSNMSLSSSSSWFIPICFEYYVCVSFFVWKNIFSVKKRLLFVANYVIFCAYNYQIIDFRL